MAINPKSFLVPINLNKNEIRQAVIENVPSGTPSSPVKGQIYFDSTNNATFVYNGTAWEKHLVAGGVTSADISGTIANAKLANSTITLGSSTLTLGSTTTSVSGLTLSLPTIGGTGAAFSGSTSGTTTVVASATAGTTTITLPATTGTVITSGDSATVTNTMLSGSIANAKLSNSSVTIGSTSVSLGSTVTSFSGVTLASPTLTTPAVGSAGLTLAGSTSGTITVVANATASGTITVPAVTGTLVTTGDSATVTSTMLAGSIANAKLANSSVTIGSTSVALGSTVATFAGVTLTTPNLGTPSTLTLTNATGLPVATGISGLGTGVATFLATPSSANLAAALTDESGSGTVAFTASPTFTGTVTVPTPTNATDAANKGYVDGIASGVNAHDAVKYATTGALGSTNNLVAGTTSVSYNNNTTGVGATLTVAVTGGVWTSITIDGQSLTVGDRVLIKNQASALQNGIYTVTQVSTLGGTSSFIFTRATDSDQVPELAAGDLTYVVAGSTLAGTSWVITTAIVTVGTDAVNWGQFAGASTTTAGAGLIANGSAFDVGTASTSRIVVNADNIDLATVTYSNTTPAATTSFVSGLTTDSYGRVTGVATTTHSVATASVAGIASFPTANFTITGNAISISNVANTVISGTILTTQGGTGLTSFTSGGAVYATSTSALTTGTLPLTAGGTGSTTAAGARTSLGAAGKYTANNSAITISSGQATWTIAQATHGLTASGGYIVQVKDLSTNSNVEVDVQINDATGDVTLGWNSASNVSANAYRVTIIG